ncbi:hypothetical protein GCM10018987_57170 [Streptomyces cremeus]
MRGREDGDEAGDAARVLRVGFVAGAATEGAPVGFAGVRESRGGLFVAARSGTGGRQGTGSARR